MRSRGLTVDPARIILAGALTPMAPPQTRAWLGRRLDNRGALVQGAVAFAMLYVIIVMAPSASAPFIYFQF